MNQNGCKTYYILNLLKELELTLREIHKHTSEINAIKINFKNVKTSVKKLT